MRLLTKARDVHHLAYLGLYTLSMLLYEADFSQGDNTTLKYVNKTYAVTVV
jgi:hypothetical protein